MKYSIRTCEENDIERVVILCSDHALYEQAAYSENGKAEKLKEAIFGERPKLYCWVVEVDGRVEGYFSYTFDYSTWDACNFLHLDCLYLEPAFRGYGIGEEVFRKLSEIANEKGCINIQWQTPDFNERAIKFYKRIGATSKNKVRFFLETKGQRKHFGKTI